MAKRCTLIAALRALSVELDSSGKEGPARHFAAVAARLDGPGEADDVRELTGEVARSAKLVELANFTRDEERMFDVVYAEAKKLLAAR